MFLSNPKAQLRKLHQELYYIHQFRNKWGQILLESALYTLIFLVDVIQEKVFRTSYNIFLTSLMPGIQSCKNCFILMSRFEGLVQTACSHHGPSAKWSVYLIFTSAVAYRFYRFGPIAEIQCIWQMCRDGCKLFAPALQKGSLE